MSHNQIEELDQLLADLLSKDDRKIVNHKTKKLTSSGENYGSVLLAVDVLISQTHQTKEQILLSIVAKFVTPNEYTQKAFNTKVTFQNEIGFYKVIVPTLSVFQSEQGVVERNVINLVPKYYGSRKSLNPESQIIDSGGAILLENLKIKGFTNMDRTVGFDLETSKLILLNLATLHATVIALKLVKPSDFEEKVMPYLTEVRLIETLPKELLDNMLSNTIDILEENEKYSIVLPKIIKLFKKSYTGLKPREPFAGIVHEDFWTSNVMVKLSEKNNKTIETKMIDFQMCHYGSPAKDLIFFLFTSVKTPVFEKHYASLVKFYHTEFVRVLGELKCDTKQFSFDAFQNEINIEAKETQLTHILILLNPIFDAKTDDYDVDAPGSKMHFGNISSAQKAKTLFVIREFIKNGWL